MSDSFEDFPEEPPEIVKQIYDIQPIVKVELDRQYKMTGQTETQYMTLVGKNGDSITKPRSKISDYLKVKWDYKSVCRLKKRFKEMVSDWRTAIEEHKEEYKKYQRLKQKFE